jgi:p-hydroxybenzoate 3-monooxygenase
MKRTRTQVGIIGCGPAGLLLSHLLDRQGIESVILERQSRAYVDARVRAGVLEQGTADMIRALGVHERMDREGLVHEGISLAFAGRKERIDLRRYSGGGTVLLYGQTQVTRDLIAARLAAGGVIAFEAPAVAVEDYLDGRPRVLYEQHGERHELRCDFVAGCDGSHGVARRSVDPGTLSTFDKAYPFGWLGILADVPPIDEELIFARHERGFALCSMRSHTRSRYYVQCDQDDAVDNWSDDAFWDELRRRLPPETAAALVTGPRLEMSIAPLRSFVTEPMRFGKLFLAGDAAHIVPPTGAKGLNLALADVTRLARALHDFFADGSSALLDAYSETALRRTWRAQRFSWWMTHMLHRLDTGNPYDDRRQLAELEYVVDSVAARTSLAENYVGSPFAELAA